MFVNGTLLTSDEISSVLNAVPEEDLNNRESFKFYFGEVIEDKPQQQVNTDNTDCFKAKYKIIYMVNFKICTKTAPNI